MYTALVLDQESQTELLARFAGKFPNDWEKIAHHMTINMGPASNGPAANLVGQEGVATVVSIASDELVAAVGVQSQIPSSNKIPHITLAVNRAQGGKPFFSNKLTNWLPVEQFELRGTVQELN